MNKLSVAIITFNEEENIKTCLDAATKVSDDIVVVDSNSTDKTVELAKSYGARTFLRDFSNFSDQKNYAISKTNKQWILSIDADEVLSPELIESINNIQYNTIDHDIVFAMNRLTNYCGKWIRHGGWYPDRKVRLWDKDKVQWEGSIHEKPVFSETHKVLLLKGDLLHYSYKSIEGHIKQANKFSILSAEKMFNTGSKSGVFFLLFAPAFTFFRMFILKLGFLDAYYGFVIAKISANATFLKHLRLLVLKDRLHKN